MSFAETDITRSLTGYGPSRSAKAGIGHGTANRFRGHASVMARTGAKPRSIKNTQQGKGVNRETTNLGTLSFGGYQRADGRLRWRRRRWDGIERLVRRPGPSGSHHFRHCRHRRADHQRQDRYQVRVRPDFGGHRGGRQLVHLRRRTGLALRRAGHHIHGPGPAFVHTEPRHHQYHAHHGAGGGIRRRKPGHGSVLHHLLRHVRRRCERPAADRADAGQAAAGQSWRGREQPEPAQPAVPAQERRRL